MKISRMDTKEGKSLDRGSGRSAAQTRNPGVSNRVSVLLLLIETGRIKASKITT